MVITTLEGHVPPDQWDKLTEVFRQASQQLPPAIYQTYLSQDYGNRNIWRITTIWHSREALEDYRLSIETPGGVLMFRSVGVEPAVSVFDVREHSVNG